MLSKKFLAFFVASVLFFQSFAEEAVPSDSELEFKKIDVEEVDESVVKDALAAANEGRNMQKVYELQLPESDFGSWHTEKIPGFLTFGHKKCTEMPGTTAAVWDNGNPAFSASGSRKWPTQRIVLPDGSVGAQLITRRVFGTIASGNLFTGAVVRKMSLRQLLGFTSKDGKQLIDWGVPFRGRPSGFRIKFAYEGLGDECSLVAVLENRDDNQRKYVASASYIGFTDDKNETNCVTRISEKDSNGLRTLEVDFMYGEYPENSNSMPKDAVQAPGDTEITHVNVVFASSLHGDYFEGKKGARLIVKDFEFLYQN